MTDKKPTRLTAVELEALLDLLAERLQLEMRLKQISYDALGEKFELHPDSVRRYMRKIRG